MHAHRRRPCCPPSHARSSSHLPIVLLELLCQSDEHEHRTGNFCTAALAALVVQNCLYCRFGVFCCVSRTCARVDICAVASVRRRGASASATKRSRSRRCPRALDLGSSSCGASSERRWRLWFVIATTRSGERCWSVGGLWSSLLATDRWRTGKPKQHTSCMLNICLSS